MSNALNLYQFMKLKKIIEKRTMSEILKDIGMSKQDMANVKKGIISDNNIKKVCDYFNITKEDILSNNLYINFEDLNLLERIKYLLIVEHGDKAITTFARDIKSSSNELKKLENNEKLNKKLYFKLTKALGPHFDAYFEDIIFDPKLDDILDFNLDTYDVIFAVKQVLNLGRIKPGENLKNIFPTTMDLNVKNYLKLACALKNTTLIKVQKDTGINVNKIQFTESELNKFKEYLDIEGDLSTLGSTISLKDFILEKLVDMNKSLSDMADETGISKMTLISNIKRSVPSEEVYEKMSQYLNISVDEIKKYPIN